MWARHPTEQVCYLARPLELGIWTEELFWDQGRSAVVHSRILRLNSKVSSRSQRHLVAVTVKGYFGNGGGFVV